MLIPSLEQLFSDPTRVKKGRTYFADTVLCLDPGQTTGFAVFRGEGLGRAPSMVVAGQLNTKDAETAFDIINQALTDYSPDHVIFENYLVYAHKATDHSNSELVTAQVIGVIKVLCKQRKLNYDKQMASQAKGFCDDEKLKAWNLWIRGQKHARDAIRHGIYWMLFTYFNPKTCSYQPKGDPNGNNSKNITTE